MYITILRIFQSAISHVEWHRPCEQHCCFWLTLWLSSQSSSFTLRFFIHKIMPVKMVAASHSFIRAQASKRHHSKVMQSDVHPLSYSKLQSSRHVNYASKVHQHLHISRWIPSRYKLTGQSLTTQPVILSLLHLHDATMASTQHRLISRSTNLIQIHSPLSSLF